MSAGMFFQFLGEQWVLVAALAAVLTLLLLHETRKAGPALSINQAVQLVNAEGGVFLDVRDAAEYGRGHITDAMHIPAASLANRVSELEKFRDKPVIVVCKICLLYTSPSPRDGLLSRMPSSA